LYPVSRRDVQRRTCGLCMVLVLLVLVLVLLVLVLLVLDLVLLVLDLVLLVLVLVLQVQLQRWVSRRFCCRTRLIVLQSIKPEESD